MMRWHLRFGLALAMTCVAGPTLAWSAEKVVPKTPKASRPIALKTAAKKAEAPAAAAASEVIVPASFTSVAEIQDATVDECETAQRHCGERVARLYRESCIGRCHQRKCEDTRIEHENAKDWFNYIRGYGPVVWVRNGPQLEWHPPSIPFAKRAGGTRARHWQGVTDIPRQPDISPLRVNQIHDENLTYQDQNQYQNQNHYRP